MAVERLTLPEEMLLLGWDDERGVNRWADNLLVVLAGAAVLELTLRGVLTVSRGQLRTVSTRTGDPLADRVLDEIAGGRVPPTVKRAVRRLGQRRWVHTTVLDQLVRRGVLRHETRRVLGLWTSAVHPVADPERVAAVRDHATSILTGTTPVTDPRDAALGALIAPSGILLRRLVPKETRRAARNRVKALAKGKASNAEVAKAIGEVNAATIAAVAAATGAAAATSSGGG